MLCDTKHKSSLPSDSNDKHRFAPQDLSWTLFFHPSLPLQILFVLVDSGKRENGKVMSYFKLKESQLPALAIYESVDDKWDTLPIAEVTVEKVRGFCEGFLKGLLQVSVGLRVNTPVLFSPCAPFLMEGIRGL